MWRVSALRFSSRTSAFSSEVLFGSMLRFPENGCGGGSDIIAVWGLAAEDFYKSWCCNLTQPSVDLVEIQQNLTFSMLLNKG